MYGRPVLGLPFRRAFCHLTASSVVTSVIIIGPKKGTSLSLMMYSLVRQVFSFSCGATSSSYSSMKSRKLMSSDLLSLALKCLSNRSASASVANPRLHLLRERP